MYAAADDRTAPYVPERTAVVTSRRRMPMQGRMSPGRITTALNIMHGGLFIHSSLWPTPSPSYLRRLQQDTRKDQVRK